MGQPFLHQLVACVRAPTCVLSGTDGQIRLDGAQGLFHADVRHLAELVVTVDGGEPVAVVHDVLDAGRARFIGAIMEIGDAIPDPTVRVERVRQATRSGFVEEIAVVNDSRGDLVVDVTLRAASDMATVGAVKHGHASTPVMPSLGPVPGWGGAGRRTDMLAVANSDEPVTFSVDRHHVVVRWAPRVPARQRASLTVTIESRGASREFTAAARPPWRSPVDVRSAHPALAPLVRRSLDDLGSMLLVDGSAGDDVFAAAGMPWFMTLFGRDSLWVARFTLPIGVGLAAGTLRTLARRQATAVDVATAAEPGKILHEVRCGPLDGIDLPPLYYGSVDATPLWISVVHDVWRWGLDETEVRDLLPAVEAAAAWLTAHDRFLSYRDESGHGLSNQGWKDSSDSIQDANGDISAPPITLCEVQGYAYRAALDAARLLEAFGRPGADVARAFATDLRARFRKEFWTSGPDGPHPAVALDGAGRLVDSLTSNIGHLPGTGILDDDEISAVAAQIPRLDSGYGLRTLADDHPRYNPLGYHTGTVWPHDTAIAIDGLAATGHGDVAGRLAGGLLDASWHFDHRLPELFAGWSRSAGRPAAYPAACRPQAWAAAAAFVVLRAALGLDVDVPAGTLAVRPDTGFASLFPLAVRGLRVGEHRLDIDVDASGEPTVETDAPLTVTLLRA